MGFTVTPLAQKARTQTLIVDSDLNLENYDLITTDAKGDTAEFDEFVGGVGNFTSGLISGGLDVSGIIHAENNMQVDGNLTLDGSLNNVNFGTNGAITTAGKVTATGGFEGNLAGNVNGTLTGSVNGNVTGNVTGSISGGTVAGSTGTFSGAVSGTKFNRSTNYTVAGSTPANSANRGPLYESLICILPIRDKLYSGSITFKTFSNAAAANIYYVTNLNYTGSNLNYFQVPQQGGTYTLTLNNAQCLYVEANTNVLLGNITVT